MSTPDTLAAQLARFDADADIAHARTPPASWYLDKDIYARELATTFRSRWHFAGRAAALAAKGAYLAGQIGDEPFFVVRDGETLRAMSNVCRHHAACLLEDTGCVEQIVCPYHGWKYDLDGRVRSAPRMAGVGAFDRGELSLPQMGVCEWGPFVFVKLDPSSGESAEAFVARMTPAKHQLDASGWMGLRYHSSRSYVLGCNWKVYVDNYLDGGYHIAHAHPGLTAQLDLDGYETELFDGGSLQTTVAAANPVDGKGGDFSARIGGGAIYLWMHPNFMVNRYGPIMDTNLVVPLGPERCEVRYDFFFEQTEGDDALRFIERSIEASDGVQAEDVGLCENVQRGVRSRAYDQGWYAPQLEKSMLQFHRLLKADLAPDDAGID